MHKLVIILGIALVFGVAAALIIPSFLDVNRYRDRIQAELERRLDRRVALGPMRLSLLPPSLQVQNVVLDEDWRLGGGQPFARVQELNVAVSLFPLLSGRLEIDSLDLRRPRIELIKNSRGEWNFSTLGERPAVPSSRQRQDKAQTTAPPPQSGPAQPENRSSLSLAKLEIHDGQIAVTDQQKRQPRAVYDHIDATLKDYAPGSPFSLVAAAHLPGGGTEELQLNVKGGPLAEGRAADTPFQGRVQLKEVSLAGLQKFLDSAALAGMDGVLSGETELKSQAGRLSAVGRLKLDQGRVRGIGIGYPISADYGLTDDLNAEVLRIEKGNLTLGKTPFGLTGTVNSGTTPARLDLQLQASDVTLAEAATLASALGIAFGRGMTFNGRLNAHLRAQGSADHPALNGTVLARDVTVSGKDLPLPVQAKAIDLALTPNDIRSNDFAITTGKTTVSSRFALRGYTTRSAMIDAMMRTGNANLDEVLNVLRACGFTSLEGITGSGTVNLDLRAAGPLKSLSSDAITRALNGALALNAANVRIPGTDINYELASIGGFLRPGQRKQPYTSVSQLTGNADIRSGVLQTNNLQAVLDQGTAIAAGTASLVDQSLHLRLNAAFSKTFSQQMGSTSVGGLLNAALADQNGQLVLPVLVTGTFQKPRYSPDMQAISRMKLKQLTGAGGSNLLQGLLGKKAAGAGQNQTKPGAQSQNADTVNDLLNSLLGGSKKKTQPPN